MLPRLQMLRATFRNSLRRRSVHMVPPLMDLYIVPPRKPVFLTFSGASLGRRRFFIAPLGRGASALIRVTSILGASAAVAVSAFEKKVSETKAVLFDAVDAASALISDTADSARLLFSKISSSSSGGSKGYSNSSGSSSQSPSNFDPNFLPAAALANDNADEKNETKTGSVAQDIDGYSKSDGLDLELTRKLIEIRSLLSSAGAMASGDLVLPSIVVIGSQSSGKSSLIEAIVGTTFLPKGSNMVTRRPLEITLVHDPDVEGIIMDLPQLQLHRVRDTSLIERALLELNVAAAPSVIDDPILLRVTSKSAPDLSLIDLPGYIQVHSSSQPVDLRDSIAQMCRRYIAPERANLIVAVCPADVDLANAESLSAARAVDPLGERTIGVITKLDARDHLQTASDEDLLHAAASTYPIQLGYVGVSARRGDGVAELRKNLMKNLESLLKEKLDDVIRGVDIELEDVVYQSKVMFSDRRITPDEYISQVLDSIKAAIREESTQMLNRAWLRDSVRQRLLGEVANLCQGAYWKPTAANLQKKHDDQRACRSVWRPWTWPWRWAFGYDVCGYEEVEIKNTHKTQTESDESFKNFVAETGFDLEKLAETTKLRLTCGGVGRIAAHHVAEMLEERVQHIAEHESLRPHEKAKSVLIEASRQIIKSKLPKCVDQAENAIKPFKVDIEISDDEWAVARHSAIEMIKNAHDPNLYQKDKNSKSNGFDEAVDTENGKLLEVQNSFLGPRLNYLASSRCAKSSSSQRCPEVYLSCIADKLAHTAVMFIYMELLTEYFRKLPRELERMLYHMPSVEDRVAFARENPLLRRQLELNEKHEALEIAQLKLRELVYRQRKLFNKKKILI